MGLIVTTRLLHEQEFGDYHVALSEYGGTTTHIIDFDRKEVSGKWVDVTRFRAEFSDPRDAARFDQKWG